MRKLQKFTVLLLLLASAISFAQTAVNVTYYDGTVQGFNVETAGKLYFESDNLYVKTNQTVAPTTIPVSIIRKVTFSNTLATATFGENHNHLVLYPNPGTEIIRIKSDTNDILKTKIYSLTGQLILEGAFQPNQDIDVSGLAKGLYLLQANGVTIKFSKK